MSEITIEYHSSMRAKVSVLSLAAKLYSISGLFALLTAAITVAVRLQRPAGRRRHRGHRDGEQGRAQYRAG
jgi:hypothetical protein